MISYVTLHDFMSFEMTLHFLESNLSGELNPKLNDNWSLAAAMERCFHTQASASEPESEESEQGFHCF